MPKTSIELLAPAKDLECGKAAIDHGADALYIGGPAFSARKAAGNSLADIETLARYAHRYQARVYLTLNTILFDEELPRARELVYQARDAGVDALIIQDMGLLQLDLPPLPLFASTQMNNVTPEHVRFLEQVGFQRVILARELSLEQIHAIRRETGLELESFVHGALCVSYSGRCYLSAALGYRSANRGECAQPCRLPWTLMDGQGQVIAKDKHLLCLKDMDRSAHLAELIRAGVNSFKIEGRLKDISYVKNITAYYRSKLDAVLEGRSDLQPASLGKTSFGFTPDPARSFCRGATEYFLHGKREDISAPTPKSLGQYIGSVTRSRQNWFTLHSPDKKTCRLHGGDGLCYFDAMGELKGIQVIKVLEGRVQARINLDALRPGMLIYRNRDHQFLKQLEGISAERRIGLELSFRETEEGFVLEALCEDGCRVEAPLITEKQPARDADAARETIAKQLTKLGDSIYAATAFHDTAGAYFIRVAELNALRRELIETLDKERQASYQRLRRADAPDAPLARYPLSELDYCFNISNEMARSFYTAHGVSSLEDAFEARSQKSGDVLMRTKHCIRHMLGACKREKGADFTEPLYLMYQDRRFLLSFDCAACEMRIVLP